ncbi:AI-2E family transporter [Marinilabilia sp.]|uniref:AI-2E family transporter n=1 Tax=Marinilabilia sp. TaxID=2021252 RepID=UPI0025B9D65E|nr:AI-2E family transporter [Marinilabilia sp.]
MGIRLKILLSAFLLLGSLYFLFHGLVSGQGFLIPVVTAVILAMLMNPVAQKLMKWGVKRVWAVLLSDLVVVLFIAFVIFLLAAQANQVVQNWSQIEKALRPKIEKVQKFYDEKLKGSIEQLKEEDNSQASNQKEVASASSDSQQQEAQPDDGQGENGQKEKDKQQTQEQTSGLSLETIKKALSGIVTNIFSFISNLMLILVYIFFFMYYQTKFENALIGLFAEEKREHVREVIGKSSKVAQKYLIGRFILIGVLAALYLIAFSIAGIEYAIFIALLAALFSLLPYVGNIVGFGLAIGMSFVSGGDTAQLVGIAISFALIQFIESYLLEPYVVGDQVELNPVVIIVGVVLGSIVWGLMGMLLVIPLLGIMKVVLDNIEPLRPFGYALDERDVSDNDEGIAEKIKKWVKNKIGK